MTVGCIRYHHTYQQGVARKWRRKKRSDFYDPLFATIGMQPVYTSELYVDSSNPQLDSTVLGYREAWSEYRMVPSQVTGQMRSGISNSLDVWHFADEYANAPSLTEQFTQENATFFERTITLEQSSQDPFILDLWFDMKVVRKMPVYSHPGLVDHH